jgi:uncharacterized protein (TIGR03083 family)
MSTPLEALRTSSDRLRQVVEPLGDSALVTSAYPTEWTVAQVLSHLGSGAVIMRRRLADVLAGTETPSDFAPSVWDEWNAKSPRAMADDGIAADRALVEAIEAVPDNVRATATFAMGPLTFTFDEYLATRLNEHAFHTWDIEVAFDDAATIPLAATTVVIDSLDLVARFTAKPSGDPATITVATTLPERGFTIALTTDGASLEQGLVAGADLELPAEAFARLLYGRLDGAHTPPHTGDDALLDRLRRTYPGP